MAYTATIYDHSVTRARVIHAGNTLLAAKRAATREFGDEFLDYLIAIHDQDGAPVSTRRVGDRRWFDYT